mgnify:CR=1 FL=1
MFEEFVTITVDELGSSGNGVVAHGARRERKPIMKTLARKTLIAGVISGATACYTGMEKDNGPAADTEGPGSAGSGESAGDDGLPPAPEAEHEVGISGMRRLTADEYDNTLRDILFDDTRTSELLLPEDPRNPFDNDFTQQVASQALVEGADLLAADAVARLLADPPRRDMVVGCMPASPGDEACMRQFVETFGRMALRRPLQLEEVDEFLHGSGARIGALDHALADGDFYTGVDSFLRGILQDPEFLYRIEIGTPVQGDGAVFKLTDYEVAARLSYFLWGSTPDDWLLGRAEQSGLSNPQAVRDVAEHMMQDLRALDRIDRFHALWLGYDRMSFSGALATAMRAETKALLERVVFDERRPWQDVFTLDETFIDETLAEHYGLPAPAASDGDWVQYGAGRRGLLSHGSYLSLGGKFNDTSPVQRGLIVRTRLFCQEIPEPDDVDVDQEPAGAICKVDRYAMHAEGGCAGCHELLDPIGFGLENYDAQGRFRTHEADNPDTDVDESQCEISGQGRLSGVGEFSGPAELGQLVVDSGQLDSCAITQLYRFAMGRYELDQLDHAFITHVLERQDGEPFHFDQLLVDFVSSEAFGYRREE